MDTKDHVEKDCNTCEHHVQGRHLLASPAKCWDCTRTQSLVHWEPKQSNSLTPTEYAALHTESTPSAPSALDVQVDGDHYKTLKIQPMEYSMGNNLDACQHTAIKYITRFRSKGGVKDLDKAIHAIQMLKEFEYGAK